MNYLQWLFKGKPTVMIDDWNCGCCGKHCSIPIIIPAYKYHNDLFDHWGLCPKCEGWQVGIEGNPKQEQTNGKLFIKTGEYRKPNIGEFYFGEIDKVACFSEDIGLDFPKDVKRFILEPIKL